MVCHAKDTQSSAVQRRTRDLGPKWWQSLGVSTSEGKVRGFCLGFGRNYDNYSRLEMGKASFDLASYECCVFRCRFDYFR